MNEPIHNMQNSRRRMARQKRIGAQIGGNLEDLSNQPAVNMPEELDETQDSAINHDISPNNITDVPDSTPERQKRFENTYGKWDDTSILLKVPERKDFWNKQRPIFWVVAAFLLVALCAVVAIIGINLWREADLARKEARRLQELAEEKAKYKFLYRDIIERYAYENNVDPALIAAIIYHESRFDPKAVSSVGARGLMQIMESTGPWIAGNLGESNAYSFDSLFVPETNIRFGTWYIGYLSRRFGGDIEKIAAGYHAGQGAVAKWLTNEAYSHDGWTLDVIPIPETEQYVRRVVNAYEIYKKHYYAPQETTPANNT